ncbi:ABC transporter substrate-binding protein, partial [uncultured Cetobacterium sp.]|uniref:ABC transporter substrate-binding protein n=1 Tax=uncultured Cetobacterium sp. TaxID=527638 RepID=UPI00261853A2
MKKIGALLASLFLLASCGAKENVTQKDKNEVVIRISQDPDFLDPSKAVSAGTDEILFNIYEGLMKIQSNGELKPAIAENYNISDDGKTYTFIIRKNIKLSNGENLTPEMIKEAYLKVMEKDFSGNSKTKAIKDNIEKIIVDGDKLIFTLKMPSKLQLPIFTFEISKKIDGMLYGTGPFEIESYSPGENIIVKKNRYYWEKTSGNLDVVEFKIIKDTQSAIMSMQMGEVDLIAKLEPQYLDLINQKDFTIVKGEQNLVQQLSINNNKSPLNNLKVREAIAYAINKNDIINGVSMGEAKACGSGVSPIVKAYYNPETENIFKYNIEKSKELLKEAGYENGLNLNLKVASNYGFNV